jgi:hypothetical protein
MCLYCIHHTAEDIFNKISGEYSPQKFNKTKTNFANPPSDLKPEQGLAKLVAEMRPVDLRVKDKLYDGFTKEATYNTIGALYLSPCCTILPKPSVLVYWQDNSVPFFTFSLCFHKK